MSGPVTPSRPRRRNRQQPCCRNIFSQLVMEMRILAFPIIILVSVLAKDYCDYLSNIKRLKITLALCACHDFTQVTISGLFVSFIRIFLITYFNKMKKNSEYKTHFSCHFCQHMLYCKKINQGKVRQNTTRFIRCNERHVSAYLVIMRLQSSTRLSILWRMLRSHHLTRNYI